MAARSRKAVPESDALLLSMQRSRQPHYRDLLHSTSPAVSRDGHTTPQQYTQTTHRYECSGIIDNELSFVK